MPEADSQEGERFTTFRLVAGEGKMMLVNGVASGEPLRYSNHTAVRTLEFHLHRVLTLEEEPS